MKIRAIKHRHLNNGPTSPFLSIKAWDSQLRAKRNRAKLRGERFWMPFENGELGTVSNVRFIASPVLS